MPSAAELCADLVAEHVALDAVVANLDEAGWRRPTPAEGWDVADSISHLCYFDEAATQAIEDPDAFEAAKQELIEAMAAGEPIDLALGRSVSGADLLERWRNSRSRYVPVALTAIEARPQARVPWYGPPMSIASFTTARIMETWAHGQDIRDALGVPPEVSPRLRHIIHIGVAARPFAFASHGLTDPGEPVRVEAEAPGGTTEPWTWGPAEAADRVNGTAVDLALVLTQRRHISRTGVQVQGPTAEAWMAIAQAFAGAPTTTAPDR
jgi:uncharacterized protein (TIGR03084 family)